MERNYTKEDITQMKGDELLNLLYEVECDIHSIQFSFTHDGIVDGSAIHQDMSLELKELKHLYEMVMDEVYVRS
jgi:hypothetical protein